jgi:hypothetical protein
MKIGMRRQPGTPAYCTEVTTNDLKSALQSADLALPAIVTL